MLDHFAPLRGRRRRIFFGPRPLVHLHRPLPHGGRVPSPASCSLSFRCLLAAVIRVLNFSAAPSTEQPSITPCYVRFSLVRSLFCLFFHFFSIMHIECVSSPYDACTAHVTITLFCSRMPKGWLLGTRGWGDRCAGFLFVSKIPFFQVEHHLLS